MALAAVLAAVFFAALGCAPDPRNVPCANDGECWKADASFKYCLQSRCVECVARGSCGEGNSCVDGRCLVKCKDDRSCPTRQVCDEGTCRAL